MFPAGSRGLAKTSLGFFFFLGGGGQRGQCECVHFFWGGITKFWGGVSV